MYGHMYVCLYVYGISALTRVGGFNPSEKNVLVRGDVYSKYSRKHSNALISMYSFTKRYRV